MPTVNEINEYLNSRVPYSTKKDYDNVGFLAGRGEAEVSRVLTALDISLGVVREAAELGAELIVSHHPLIFNAMKSVTTGDYNGRRVAELISGGMSAICLHTNLDSVAGGVSDELCARLGVRAMGVLDPERGVLGGMEYGFGRVGELDAAESFGDFLARVKAALNAAGLRYVDAKRQVRRVAVCGGSGGDLLEAAKALGCDTFVTGEVKHSYFLMASELGVNLIDAGHFSTENVIVPKIARLLREGFPGLDVVVSGAGVQPERYYV